MLEKECTKCKVIKSYESFYRDDRTKSGLQSQCKGCNNRYRFIYHRTKDGLIKGIYSNQINNSKQRTHKLPIYTIVELKDWLFSQKLFHELFDNWVNSGYKRELAPSVDRKNDYKEYSLNNIQLMTWSENRTKGHSDRKNGINNKRSISVLQYDLEGNFIKEYYSINQAQRETGVSTGSISIMCRDRRNKTGKFIWKYKN